MDGIVCIDKPQGFTSFDVIAKLRGMLKTRKVGHAGTLDPLATGVLPIFIGTATKASDMTESSDKEYHAGFRLGISTDTQDITGEVLEQKEAACTKEQLEAALASFRGEITQIPPMYSAVQVNGVRLYDLARQGIEVERKPRTVYISALELLAFDEETQSGELRVRCSKGTYVRTICHDLGQMLGTGAAMITLRRTEAAGFTLADCYTLEQAQQITEAGTWDEVLRPVSSVFAKYPQLLLNNEGRRLYVNGVRLSEKRVKQLSESTTELKPDTDYAVYHGDEFLGTAYFEWEESRLVLRVGKLFCRRPECQN